MLLNYELGGYGPSGQATGSLNAPYSGIAASKAAGAARLPGVAAAVGGITLLERLTTFPRSGDGIPQFGGYTVDGADTADRPLGPLGLRVTGFRSLPRWN